LTTTTRTLTRERLVDSILRPSKEIAPMFVPWQIETEDGRVLAGMLVSQAVNGELTYADEKGELFRLKPSEIEARRPSAKSIMPDGLSNSLTLQEFRDLLAFLLGPQTATTSSKAAAAGK
jgi:putative heme-binding domain-containing protein